MEFQARHASDSGGQRNERSNDRQQARDQDGDGTAPLEKAVGDVELTFAQKDVAAETLDQRTSPEVTDFVSQHRSQVAAQRAPGGDGDERKPAGVNQVAGERHDDLRRKRYAR